MAIWWFRQYISIILYINCFSRISAEFEGFVVGGDYVNIKEYPHSAFLRISCYRGYSVEAYKCGSSIINQYFTLTAAHCLYGCVVGKTHLSVGVGHEQIQKGTKLSAKTFKVHENYEETAIKFDIALVQLQAPLKLSLRIQKVVLLKPNQSPTGEVDGYVAGWGLVDDINLVQSDKLKRLMQPVWTKRNCKQFLGKLNVGTICAGYKSGNNYAAPGDSGSALVINNYFQIGLVSYKNPKKSKSVIVYTEVAYFYDWIQTHTEQMHCGYDQTKSRFYKENRILEYG